VTRETGIRLHPGRFRDLSSHYPTHAMTVRDSRKRVRVSAIFYHFIPPEREDLQKEISEWVQLTSRDSKTKTLFFGQTERTFGPVRSVASVPSVGPRRGHSCRRRQSSSRATERRAVRFDSFIFNFRAHRIARSSTQRYLLLPRRFREVRVISRC